MRRRLIWLNILFLIFTALIVKRFFTLQVSSHEYFRELADNQHLYYRTLVPERGEILIRGDSGDLTPLVTNIEKNLVFAVPSEIKDKADTASKLSGIIEMDKKEISDKIQDDSRKWVAIKKQLPESVSLQIEALRLPGIYLQAEDLRFYPEGKFAAQVLGFMAFEGDERVGQYGVEKYYEKQLKGEAGSLLSEKDAFGRWITSGDRSVEPAKDGEDIALTINRSVQFKAEEALSAEVARQQADSGSIIVLNPKTGAILAMANSPSFDPNEFNKEENPAVYRNRAVSDAYEPGSVFKPITMAAALDDGVVTPDMTYEDTGQAVIDGFVIKNSDLKAHGVQTMTQVLEQSLNTGAIFVQDRLGPEKFLKKVKEFGFGSLTGVDLPAESPGDLRNLSGGGDVHYATASFGQGITVTLMQLASAYAAIANEGRLVKPHVLAATGNDGSFTDYKAEDGKQVISPRAANMLGAMMVSVVENGHGKQAAIPGYYVAGKTGTAQVAKQDGRGYDPNVMIGSFVGFAPVENPAFVIAVRIDNPKQVRFAESTAAPVFSEVGRFLVNYYHISPNR